MKKNYKPNILLVSGNSSLANGASRAFLDLASCLKKNYNVISMVDCEGELTKALRKKDINVIIKKQYSRIWLTTKDTKENKKTKYKLKILLWKLIKNYHIISDTKLIRKYNIKLIHLNTATIGFPAFAALKSKTPYIFHFREILNESGFNREFLINDECFSLVNNSNAVISISKCVEKAHSHFVNKNNSHIIYDGVSIKKFYCKRNIFNHKNLIKVVSCGRMIKEKGHFEIVQAVCKLNKVGINIKLDIYGINEDDIYTNNIISYINKHNLNKVISYKGFSNKPQSLYKNYDIFITNSYNEPFGLTTIEAMLSGCVVIGSAKGATLELISNNNTGILYENTSAENIFKVLKSVWNNIDKYKQIALQGQNNALSYSYENNAKKIMQIYKAILKQKGRS